MKTKAAVLLISIMSLSLSLMASTNRADVIYGEDNRVDVFESTNSAYVELSRSTAAMISSSRLSEEINGDFQVEGRSLEKLGICSSERFAKQMTSANCSGFLVAEDILITAGHCIQSEADCRGFRWVFDYKVDHAEQADVRVPASSVYSCKEIITRALDMNSKDDYAMIRLERKVTDRAPLKFRRSGKAAVGDKLVVIGHPTGLPTKIADGASVRSLSGKYFTANLDSYGGNSGSAVFNSESGVVEGILVRGENDYVLDNRQGCRVSNRCANNACRGEDVTFITNVPGLNKL